MSLGRPSYLSGRFKQASYAGIARMAPLRAPRSRPGRGAHLSCDVQRS